MISYKRLWEYAKEYNISQYRMLQEGISHSTLSRLKKNQYVSVETIDKLCGIMNCRVEDIMEYVKESK